MFASIRNFKEPPIVYIIINICTSSQVNYEQSNKHKPWNIRTMDGQSATFWTALHEAILSGLFP